MSKYMKADQQHTVAKHKHCLVCATPIGMDREFCGTNCEDQFRKMERRRKYQLFLPLLMLPVLFLLIFFLTARR